MSETKTRRTRKTHNKSGDPDGRVVRSERSRQKILDAALALVREGNLVPTAPQVAERAGVGLRTIFRHFSDMESLAASMDQHIGDTYDRLFIEVDRDGSLPERILHAAESHDHAFAKARQIILSTQAQLWQSRILRENWARKRRGLRRDLRIWLPEVKTLSPARQAAAEAAMSFETWHQLRFDQGLSRKATVATINEMMCLLFEVEE